MPNKQFNKPTKNHNIDRRKTTSATTLMFIMGCLLLLMLFAGKTASAQTLVIQDGDDQISAVPYITLLEDPSHTLTIEQVISPAYENQFKPRPDGHLNLGYNQSAWWLKLEVEQQTSQSWYALIDFVAFSQVDAFLMPSQSDKLIELGNMRQEFSFQRQPTVHLPEAIDRFTLYLRVDNYGKEILWLPVQLISADALIIKTAKDYLFYGGIIFGLLILVPYNIFLYFSLRNTTYLSLVTFLICLILVLQRTSNTIPWLSPFSNPTSFYYLLCFQLVGISGIQFWRQLADSKKLFPRSDKFMRILLLLMIVQIPFLQVLPYPDSWSYSATAAIMFVTSYFSLFALYKQSRAMLSFSLAFFVFIGCAVPAILWGIGFLVEVNAPVRLFHVGSLLFGLLLSITLAEHTRQLRLQAERSKTENAAKDNFLTTISHELRTPMYAVISAVDLFKFTPLSDQQKNYLHKLKISADHMLNLINQALDLGRMNSAEFILEKRPFRLNDALQEVRQLLSEEAAKKQLLFTIENHVSIPGKLLVCDSTRFKQVLLNLLYNAIKFTDKGSVTLSIEHASDDHLNGKTATLQYRITDTGIGIPEEQHQYIFQPFSQVENSTKRRYHGSGMGLAISYKLISQMGGTLQLTSTPGKGSCFFFTITYLLHDEPTDPAISSLPHPETPETPETNDEQGKITVLLVDDVQLNRFWSGELLQMLGVTAITVDSGKAALQTLREQKQPAIDLVFMDVSMPDMDGYETTRRIRSETRFAGLPVVALTAHAIEGERERCLASGMNDYLAKPFGLEQLQEKIRQWTTDNKGKPPKTDDWNQQDTP